MTMVADTGKREQRPCESCGSTLEQRQGVFIHKGEKRTCWMPEKHKAPCGLPCMGGGIRPIPTAERKPGSPRLPPCHRIDRCGRRWPQQTTALVCLRFYDVHLSPWHELIINFPSALISARLVRSSKFL